MIIFLFLNLNVRGLLLENELSAFAVTKMNIFQEPQDTQRDAGSYSLFQKVTSRRSRRSSESATRQDNKLNSGRYERYDM